MSNSVLVFRIPSTECDQRQMGSYITPSLVSGETPLPSALSRAPFRVIVLENPQQAVNSPLDIAPIPPTTTSVTAFPQWLLNHSTECVGIEVCADEMSLFHDLCAVLQAMQRCQSEKLINFRLVTFTQSRSRGQMLDLADAVNGAVTSFHNIQALCLPLAILDHDWSACFMSLSTLELLKDLELYRDPQPRVGGPKTVTFRNAVGFSQLRKVTIKGFLQDSVDVVRTIARPLTNLHIDCDRLDSRNDLALALHQICNACEIRVLPAYPSLPPAGTALSAMGIGQMFFQGGIPRPVALTSLRDVQINIRNGMPDQAAWINIRPLLAAKEMETFSISFPHPLVIDRSDITDMLGAWGRLRSLSLNPRPTSGLAANPGNLPSVRSLKDVARCGPALDSFSALLDGMSLEGFETDASPLWRRWETLKQLDLGYSVGDDDEFHLDSLSRHIRTLFPKATLMKDGTSDWVKRLASVHAHLADD